MKKRLLISFLVISIATLSGCKKNRTLNLLAGDWEVTSFTIDGVETISSDFIGSFQMEYEDYDGSEGDFDWTMVIYGSTLIFRGEYECNEAADELELRFIGDQFFDSEIAEFDFVVSKEEVTLEGNVDGYAFEIEADRD